MTDSNIPELVTRKQALTLGLKKYYTGELCGNGHDSLKYTNKTGGSGSCCKCASEAQKNRWKYHKDEVNNKKSEEYKNNPQGKILWQIRSRSKSRGIYFDLKKEDIIIPTNCPCCDNIMSFKPVGFGSVQNDTPSVDRINNNLGYISSNIIIICFRCNSLKKDATATELRRLADFIDKIMSYKWDTPNATFKI